MTAFCAGDDFSALSRGAFGGQGHFCPCAAAVRDGCAGGRSCPPGDVPGDEYAAGGGVGQGMGDAAAVADDIQAGVTAL